jgi:hypothetical protein
LNAPLLRAVLISIEQLSVNSALADSFDTGASVVGRASIDGVDNQHVEGRAATPEQESGFLQGFRQGYRCRRFGTFDVLLGYRKTCRRD